MKTIVITGANGFIGQNLINRFIVEDCIIYAVDLSFENCLGYDDNKVIKIECDLKNVSDLPKKVGTAAIDVFYHFAWDGSTGLNRSDYSKQLNNVKYTCDAAITANKMNCKRFISTGTISERIVEDSQVNSCSPNLIYAAAKSTTRKLLNIISAQFEMTYTWAQLSNIFGEHNKTGNLLSYTMNEICNGRIPEYGPCDQMYDFLYIDDAIEALYRIGTANEAKNFYFVGSGAPRLLKEYLDFIGKRMDVKLGIGKKKSDGILYKSEWFDTFDLENDFNFKTKYSFEQAINKIINKMGM